MRNSSVHSPRLVSSLNVLVPVRRCLPVVLLAVLACSCRSKSQETSNRAPESQVAGPPSIVTITARDYTFEAPEAIEAGWTTFHLVNRGTRLHAAQLVRLEEGHTLPEFLVVYEHAWRTIGPRPKWGKRSGGPGAIEPQGTSNATMYLEPGNYAWYCPMNVEDGVPHVFGKGMSRGFVVKARQAATRQTAPRPSVVVKMSDYAFSLSTPLTAGRHVIKLVNVGVEPHELGIVRLAPGRTFKDFQAWAKDFRGPLPGTVIGGVNSLASRLEGYFEVDLDPGSYVLLCFVTAPDGRPHSDHGMIQGITVK